MRKKIHVKDAKNSYFLKVNIRKKICTKNVGKFSFFRINSNSFSIMACLSFHWSWQKFAAYPLIQLSFSYPLFYGAEIYKLEIFKTCHLQKISTREIWFFLARKNKYTRKLVRLIYAMFLSELSPLNFPSSDSACLGWINIDTRCYFAQ